MVGKNFKLSRNPSLKASAACDRFVAVQFYLESFGSTCCGFQAVLLFFVRVCCRPYFLHIRIVDFHELLFGFFVDCSGDDEVGEPVLWSESCYVGVSAKG